MKNTVRLFAALEVKAIKNLSIVKGGGADGEVRSRLTYDSIDNAPEEKERGIINPSKK